MGQFFGKIDVATPPYSVQPCPGTCSGFELRQYEPQVHASVSYVPGSKDENSSFMTLASYIGVFGTPKNEVWCEKDQRMEPEAVAMTAPVVSSGAASTGVVTVERTAALRGSTAADSMEQSMTFILPTKYDIDTAPKPLDEKVTLSAEPGRLLAVKSFRGNTDQKTAAPKAEDFVKELQAEGFTVLGDWELARYNPPFTVPALKTNEIWVEVSHN